MSSDESPAVVELPDDELAAAARAVERAVGGQLAHWPHDPERYFRFAAEDVLRGVEPLIAARVHAEAVAGERQRITGEFAKAAWVAFKADGETDAQRLLEVASRIADGYPAGGSNTTEAAARLLRFVAGFLSAEPDSLAAGSVPVATPPPDSRLALLGPARMVLDRCAVRENPADPDNTEAGRMAQRIVDAIGHPVTDQHPVSTPPDHFIITKHADGSLTTAPGPVATRLQPGRVGFGTDAFEAGGALPGQPVATPTEPIHMHNRDGPCSACASATPTEPACRCDGAAYHSAERNAQRQPFIVNPACPLHGARSAAEATTAALAGSGLPAGLWAEIVAASPVPAEQPPTCKHGETAPHGVGQYAPGGFPDHYCPGPMVAEQPEPKGVAGHAPGCDGWRPPRALGFGRSIPKRCLPGCPRAEQPEER